MAASVSRPWHLSSASVAPHFTSVGSGSGSGSGSGPTVAPRGCVLVGFSRAVSPQSWRPGLALPTRSAAQLHKCSSGRRCAGRQLYVFSSYSGAAQKRPPRRGPPRLRQDGAMSEGNFPAQIGESLFIGAGITTGGQLHSLIQPGSLPTIAPHSC